VDHAVTEESLEGGAFGQAPPPPAFEIHAAFALGKERNACACAGEYARSGERHSPELRLRDYDA
jgi:hypothetical protein